jgi:glycosidase
MDPNGDGNPSDGIDGWRLDVAYCIKHQFWKDWREHVKTINPDAYITAEIVDSVEVVKPYLRGDEFDAVMNYNFLFACAEYFIDDSTVITTSVFDEKLRELRNSFPEDVAFVQQNLFDSHDTQRILSHIVNKDKYKLRNWGNVFDKTKGSNPVYETRKPTEEEITVLKLMLIFQMTYVGAPYVYYGDEAGMWGANDPDCRKPMVWSDIVYEDERYLPDQKHKSVPDKVNFNKELFEFYKKIINIRNKNEVLQIGDFKVLMIDDEKRIYVYQRNYNGKEIIVAINIGNSEQLITLKTEHKEYYSDLLSESPKIFVKDGKLNFPISSYNGCILRKDYYR